MVEQDKTLDLVVQRVRIENTSIEKYSHQIVCIFNLKTLCFERKVTEV